MLFMCQKIQISVTTGFPNCISWLSLQKLIHATNRKREIWEAEKVYILSDLKKKIKKFSVVVISKRTTGSPLGT